MTASAASLNASGPGALQASGPGAEKPNVFTVKAKQADFHAVLVDKLGKKILLGETFHITYHLGGGNKFTACISFTSKEIVVDSHTKTLDFTPEEPFPFGANVMRGLKTAQWVDTPKGKARIEYSMGLGEMESAGKLMPTVISYFEMLCKNKALS